MKNSLDKISFLSVTPDNIMSQLIGHQKFAWVKGQTWLAPAEIGHAF